MNHPHVGRVALMKVYKHIQRHYSHNQVATVLAATVAVTLLLFI